jgi:hypothetical protein
VDGTARLRILDPALFWRKLVLLLVFSLLFLPLKYYRLDRYLEAYILLLLLLHVYFVFVLVHRVRWRALAEHRRSFLLRLLAVGLFIALLARQSTGATFADFALFLGVSLVIHTGLLLSLTVVARADPWPVAADAR